MTNTLYVLSVKEWNLDPALHRLLWNPFKWLGNKTASIPAITAAILITAVFAGGLTGMYFQPQLSPDINSTLPILFSSIGLLLILRSFAHRANAVHAWTFVIAGHLFVILAVALLNEQFTYVKVAYYLSGTIISAAVGYWCLSRLKSAEGNIYLDRFHGHTYEHPKTGFIFLLACLGFAGLPFTPAFIGMDLLFSHIGKNDFTVIFVTALSFIFLELSLLRIYSRVFLGHHKKAYHPMAFKYS